MLLFLLNSGFKQYGSQLKNYQLFSFADKSDCNQLWFEIINREGKWEKINFIPFCVKMNKQETWKVISALNKYL